MKIVNVTTKSSAAQPQRRRILRLRLTRDLRTYAEIADDNLRGLPSYGESTK